MTPEDEALVDQAVERMRVDFENHPAVRLERVEAKLKDAEHLLDAIGAVVLFSPDSPDAEKLAALRFLLRQRNVEHVRGCLGGHFGDCAVSGLFDKEK